MKREREEVDEEVEELAVNNFEDEDEEDENGKRQKTEEETEESRLKDEQQKQLFVEQVKKKVCEQFQLSPNQVHYDDNNFMLNYELKEKNENGKDEIKPHSVFLTNYYLRWIRFSDLNDQEGQQKFLAESVSSFNESYELPSSFDEAKDFLFPKMQVRVTKTILKIQEKLATKGLSNNHSSKSEANSLETDIPWKPVTDFFGIDVVFDTPTQFLLLKPSDLKKWNKTFDEVYEKAIDNLRKSEIVFNEIGPGVWAASSGKSYEAPTLLALPEKFKSLEVNGNLIALPVSKTMILATGSEDVDGLEALLEIAANTESDPNFFSATMLTLRDNEWVEFVLPENHEFSNDYKFLKLQTFSSWYKHQQEYIEKLKESDATVASYNAVSSPEDGSALTIASWTKGVNTLLPKVDLIEFLVPKEQKTDEPPSAFVIPNQPETISCYWLDAMRILGQNTLKEVDDYYPVLYNARADLFPNEDQLDSLRLSQIEI